MNRQLAAGLVLGGCLALALGTAQQPERIRDRQSTGTDALIKNVEAYAIRQADALETTKVLWANGKMTRAESLAVQRAELESRLLLAQITDKQTAVTDLLTDLVEHDAAQMDEALTVGRFRGELATHELLAISERLARSSFRLWEHKQELAESK